MTVVFPEELMPCVASWGFVWSKVADLIPVYLFLGRTWMVQSMGSSLVPIDFVRLFFVCTCFWVTACDDLDQIWDSFVHGRAKNIILDF